MGALTFLGVGLVLTASPNQSFPLPEGHYGDRGTVNAFAFMGDHLILATRGGVMSWSPGKPPRDIGWNGLIDGRGPTDLWLEGATIYGSVDGVVASRETGSFTVRPDVKPRTASPPVLGESGFVDNPTPVWPEQPESMFAPSGQIRGTHVTAVAIGDGRLTAAWYGDGLWKHSGKGWWPVDVPDPSAMRHVRTLAANGDDLAVATFSGEVFWRKNNKWRRMPTPNLPVGSVYSLESLDKALLAGSFEHGVSVRQKARWNQELASLSSPHARHMVRFKGRIYVRQTTGEIDRFDGKAWAKNVFPWLPRGAASCLAVGDGKLMVGQWGGWSEFDGAKWAHFLKLPELQGFVVTALAAEPGQAWIGSQEKGLFGFDRSTGTIAQYDQRHGFENDWVRRILIDQEGLTVGMFLTGAYRLKDGKFVRLTPEIRGEATGFARDPKFGQFYIASREGLWRLGGEGAKRIPVGGVDRLEIQCALEGRDEVALGTPNGLAIVSWASLRN